MASRRGPSGAWGVGKMPRPTSRGPTHGPHGGPAREYPSEIYPGWYGDVTAFNLCLACGGIDAADIVVGRAPQHYADILAYEV